MALIFDNDLDNENIDIAARVIDKPVFPSSWIQDHVAFTDHDFFTVERHQTLPLQHDIHFFIIAMSVIADCRPGRNDYAIAKSNVTFKI